MAQLASQFAFLLVNLSCLTSASALNHRPHSPTSTFFASINLRAINQLFMMKFLLANFVACAGADWLF